MVLDNASAAPSADFADAAPPSDDDLYSPSSSSMTHTSYNIDTTNFPKVIPLLGPLFGYSEKKYRDVLQIRLAGVSQQLGRPLTHEEADSFGYWTAKAMAILSFAGPVGFAGGAWRWHNTKATFRYPFWQPNMETFDRKIFPAQRMPLLKGQWASRIWGSSRLCAYLAIGGLISQTLFGSYAASVCAVGELSDQRLKPMMDQLRKKHGQQMGALPNETKGPGQQRMPPMLPNSEPDNDASPTGGLLWGEPVKVDGTPSTPESRPQWNLNKPSPAQPMAASESRDSLFDLFDDASPTSGQGVATNTPSAPQGSAWERLRRGDKPAHMSGTSSDRTSWQRRQKETQDEQRQGATTGDNFTISKTEEETSYAKVEAQRDARVEQERRGGSFSSNDQRRW